MEKIFIFTHNITSNSEHCYKGHTIDQKIDNYQLQHGIIDENYMWISTDKLTLFANPQTCEMYFNQTNLNEYIFKDNTHTYFYKTTVYGANNEIFILDYYNRYLWQIGAYCQIGCKSCQEYTHCFNCIGHQRNHDSVQNICLCSDGYFDNLQSYNCESCPSLCTKCTDYNNCNDCVPSSPVQRDPQKICECPISSYEDSSNNCQPCLFQCETCQNSNICLTCVPSIPERIGDTCFCPDTYYDNQLDYNCQECKFPCLNCENDTYCNTCVFSEPARLLINNDCACPIMYYSVQGIENCFKCPYRCYQCETGDKCQSCRFPYFRLIEDDCSCRDGYYDDGENPFCIKCPSQCKTCINGNECTSCLNQQALMPYCTQIMNHQFFSKNSIEEFQYQRCPLKCQNCYDRNTCMSCQGLNREGILKNCICKQGYHDEFGMQKDCQKCQKLCKNCLSSSYCNECQDLEHLYLYPGGKCDCELGFKYDQIKKKCVKAYRYKQDFYHQCPRNTVYSKSSDSCLDRKVFEEEKVFKYYLYGSLVVLASFVVCLVLIIKMNKIIERAQNMTLEEVCRFYDL
ncbi:Insulin-like growth factor binding protein, N-terminal [Pseudocohnilembus persalinus]|uniref:Insulin-like growth factor binding protein, N-terminal n=1 Tax=Pseudocohnilembus persalinus TaxID=266149 RepID=A0A0V0QV16_PSEPJ|nr:Insulin-like growth factor binding protein, N-terminal [Pseudocohnilembus persalinus]|eukprot:KRX06091.1 Insulin-like growth factor binding protein, N-terminal [Pseudocohnilembus persalinus]